MSVKNSNGYYVFVKDAGEYNLDWSVSFHAGGSPEQALEQAFVEGYGRDDATAVVVHEDDAHLFGIEQIRGLKAIPHASRAEVLKG